MKELSLRDLVFTQIFFAVGLPRIGVAGKLGASHTVYWLLAIAFLRFMRGCGHFSEHPHGWKGPLSVGETWL